MSGPGVLDQVLNNAVATQNLMDTLAIKNRSVRFMISDTVLPVVILDETDPTVIQRRAFGAATQAAVAAQFAAVQLLNPADSAVTLTTETFDIFSTSVLGIGLRRFDTVLASAGVSNFRDLVIGKGPVGATRVESLGAVSGTTLQFYQFEVQILVEITLGPGEGIMLQNISANTALSVNWLWTESNA